MSLKCYPVYAVLMLLYIPSVTFADGSLSTSTKEVSISSKFSEMEVTQKADAFLKKLRSVTYGKVQASFQAIGTSSLRANRYRSLWRLAIPTSDSITDIEVADDTGAICSFFKRSNHRTVTQSSAEYLPRAEAIRKATAALTAAGILPSTELTFKEAIPMQTSPVSATWFVSWSRTEAGIPYREQDTNVILDAKTGELLAFSNNSKTPKPSRVTFVVDRNTATITAGNLLAGIGLSNLSTPKITQEIVQPNTFWTEGGNESTNSNYAVAAWILRYQSETAIYEVWIDGKTGNVIGGQRIGKDGRGVNRQPSTPDTSTSILYRHE